MANSIMLKGDWRKLRPMASKLSKLPQEYEDEVMPELLELAETALKRTIEVGLPPENTKATIKRKGFNKPLTETGTFPSTITHIEASYKDSKSRARKSYLITADKSVHHIRTNTSYRDILGILDQGGGNVPDRNILSQSYDMVSNELKRKAIMKLKEVMD